VWGSGFTCATKDLPIEDDTFDAVIRAHVPEHLDDPFAGLSEIVRVPKPGGSLIVSQPAAAPPTRC
jgi:ubiquinone/menaquinone biosynthesis C-methylase UbiE